MPARNLKIRKQIDVVADGVSPMWFDWIRGVAEYADSRNGHRPHVERWQLALRDGRSTHLPDQLAESPSIGVIGRGDQSSFQQGLDRLRQNRLDRGQSVPAAVVVMQSVHGRRPEALPCVAFHDPMIGELAADHLHPLGGPWVFFGLEEKWSVEREGGFRRRLAELGVDVEDRSQLRVSRNKHDDYHGWASVDALLADLPRPCTVFAAADWIALGLLEGCQRLEIAVPEDLAVLGVDNQAFRCQYAPVPLSSVDPNSRTVGTAAARLLDALLDGASSPDGPVRVPPAGVVERRSTQRVLHGDAAVDRALRLMRDPKEWPLTAQDIAEAVGLSRRALERRFLKRLARTPGELLRECRLDAARKLVRETETPMIEIAVRCGFSSAGNFSRAYRVAFACSPREDRQRALNQQPFGAAT